MTVNTHGEKKAGWKKVFGGSKSTKEKGIRGKAGKMRVDFRDGGGEKDAGGPGGGGSGHGKGGGDGGFMGVGRDGVWISRKNFVKN